MLPHYHGHVVPKIIELLQYMVVWALNFVWLDKL